MVLRSTTIWRICGFSTQGRLFYLPNIYFPEQEHIIFVRFSLKICNLPPCYPKYECNLWLYYTLTKAQFDGTKTFVGTITWMGNTHFSVDTFCISSVIKSNHKRGWHLVHLVSHLRGERNILATWVVFTKRRTIFSKLIAKR